MSPKSVEVMEREGGAIYETRPTDSPLAQEVVARTFSETVKEK